MQLYSTVLAFATAITWTPFNKPSDISGNGEVIQLYYNHDHERWRVYCAGPGGSQSTYFIGTNKAWHLLSVQPGG